MTASLDASDGIAADAAELKHHFVAAAVDACRRAEQAVTLATEQLEAARQREHECKLQWAKETSEVNRLLPGRKQAKADAPLYLRAAEAAVLQAEGALAEAKRQFEDRVAALAKETNR